MVGRLKKSDFAHMYSVKVFCLDNFDGTIQEVASVSGAKLSPKSTFMGGYALICQKPVHKYNQT